MYGYLCKTKVVCHMAQIILYNLILVESSYQAQPGNLRVYQGKEDLHNEFPFVVALYYDNERGCSGSLISKTWVITAGHCIHLVSSGVITVRYTASKFKANKLKEVETIETYLHPRYSRHIKYKSETIRNDIGLILTEEAATESFVRFSAVNFKALLGLKVNYAGFGKTGKKLNKDKMKWPLHIGEGVVTSCPVRRDGFHPAMCVTPRRSTEGQMIGQGDSGGPLLCKGKLVAVASGRETDWGATSIFTPVSPHLHWIRDVVSS